VANNFERALIIVPSCHTIEIYNKFYTQKISHEKMAELVLLYW